MAQDQEKSLAEKTFWNSWGKFAPNESIYTDQNEGDLSTAHSSRLNAKEYAARVAQQQAVERRKDNLKLLAMMVFGFLVICLVVFLLGLFDGKSDLSATVANDNSQKSAAQVIEDPAEIEASIQEEMIKGGFTSKDAYFSAELAKQSLDVGDDLVEFGKKINPFVSKMNITGLVIEKKMDQLTKLKAINGFGVELVKLGDESDDFKLISHLKGKTSSVEFFAEHGRIVAHFKDYPASYCAGTKGSAVCGS
jgi:hypothetical protein